MGGVAFYEEGHEDGPLGVRATAMFSSWLLDGAGERSGRDLDFELTGYSIPLPCQKRP